MGKKSTDDVKGLCGYYNYTVVLTYVGMLTGFTGLLFVMEGAFRYAVLCLMAAGVCDMFDGTIAATKQRDEREKRFGIQIDSLSDLICFGVLPAVLTYRISGKSYFSFLTACLYMLCALIRLAYFNVLEEERQQTETGKRSFYLGLPVTMAALIFPLFFILWGRHFPGSDKILLAIMILMAAAFVVPVKVKKAYLAGKIGMIIAGIVEFAVVFFRIGLKI